MATEEKPVVPPPWVPRRKREESPPPPWDETPFEEIRRLETADRTQQEPRERKRTVPMRALVIGLSQTGTLSIRTALKRLGFKGVYHGMSLIANPPDAYMWDAHLRYKYTGRGRPFTRADWDCLLGNDQVAMGMPCAACMPELIEAYLEAKVVVVERPEDAWYRSIRAGFGVMEAHLRDPVLAWLDGELFRPWAAVLRWTPQLWGNKRPDDEAGMKRIYRSYLAEVRGLVPEGDRRLEYRLGDGWEPLCRFLGCEVPKDLPFPRVNEHKELAETMAYLQAEAWKRARWIIFQFFMRIVVMGVIALGPLLFVPKELFADFGKGGDL